MRAIRSTLAFPPALLLKSQGGGLGMKAAIFDVDGVLTDGRLLIEEGGEKLKAFHVLDGHGLKLLAQGGILPVIVTGRDSAAVRRRVPHRSCAAENAGRRLYECRPAVVLPHPPRSPA